uniref:Plant bHLH transcription factor ACT-like domain-containing protein n=1 Tax=Solanum lycopersicum TaxID=4081 RepID=A0A3Q7I028_SOLLC
MLVIVGRNYLGDQGTTSNSSFIKPITHGANPLMVNNNIPTSFMTWSSPDMILNVCGKDAHISVCCPKKLGLFTFICYVLGKHNIEIVSAQVSSDQSRTMFMIQAHFKDCEQGFLVKIIFNLFYVSLYIQAKGGIGIAKFSEAPTVEEIYKQVAIKIIIFSFKFHSVEDEWLLQIVSSSDKG